MKSSSGGAYTAISDKILFQGGACYGSVFTDSNDVIFQKARTKWERDLFLGSKYVQSDIKNSYFDIGMELKNQERVLFTGTPCQVAGLKQFLKAKKISMEHLFNYINRSKIRIRNRFPKSCLFREVIIVR